MALVLGTMAAYAIARLDFPGKRAIVAMSLLISMFPQIALVTPLFKIETAIGIFDTWLGLILPYITFALPLASTPSRRSSGRSRGSWRRPPRWTAPRRTRPSAR